MKIIIAGAGSVGFHIAKMLSHESQDIVLVDTDQEKLLYAETHIDVMTLHGNSTSPSILLEAKVESTDLLIAVTSSETTNLTTALMAKQLGVKRTIARITNSELLSCAEQIDFTSIGIDNLISPEELAATEISHLMDNPAVTERADFADGTLSLIGVHLNPKAQIIGKSIVEAAQMVPELKIMPVAILRKNKTIIPRGSTEFGHQDLVYFLTPPDDIPKIVALCGKTVHHIKNIMILGGSKIGVNAARKLSENYNVKLIERNREKARELADQLPNTLVINGDGRDVELLNEEQIENMHAFISVTGNSETNIMSCLVAKGQGVEKTIALVENIDYINVSQTIGIETMLNKKLLAASAIFRYVRQGSVVNLANISGIVEAEVLEFEVGPTCKATQKPIKKLDFPAAAIIGGVVRKGEGMTVLGDFQIEPNDRVVIFSMPEAIQKVEALFK